MASGMDLVLVMRLLILLLSLCKYTSIDYPSVSAKSHSLVILLFNIRIICCIPLSVSVSVSVYHNCVVVLRSTHGTQGNLLSPAQPTTAINAKFGCSVAIGSTGGYMVVGESGYPLQSYVYVNTGATWSLTDTLVAPVAQTELEFGKYVAVYDDTIVLSNSLHRVSNNKGHAFVYKLISGTSL
jgi:hypothetical protein